MITAQEIKRRLAEQAESVCRHLLPHGKRVGRQWKCGDIYGAAGDSTIVELDGSRAGVWGDFANLDSAKGDLLDLWQAVRGSAFREAFIEAKKFLNIRDPQESGVPSKKYSRPAPKSVLSLRKAKDLKPATPEWKVESYLQDERKITREVIHAFKIGAAENRMPNSGTEVVFPSESPAGALVNVKYVALHRTPEGKKITSAEPGCAPSMFGWQAFEKGSRVVILTEGECDCMSWHVWGYNMALSIPNGAANMHWIDYEWENLEPFETIYIAFDNDEPGIKASLIAAQRLGLHRCRIVKIPGKDVNEMLQKGATIEDAMRWLDESRCISPVEIKSISEFREQVHRMIHPPSEDDESLGLKTPIFGPRFRFRPGETTLWTGHTSHGKSTLLSQLMLHACLAGQRVAIGSFEVNGPTQAKKMVHCTALEKNPTTEQIDQVLDWLADKVWVYHIVGIVKQDKLFELMEYSVKRHGVDHIVIDSLMKCDLSSDDYEAQRQFINRVVTFGQGNNVHMHLVAHPRKDKTDEAPPGIYDVNGGQAVVGQPDNIVVVHRNKRKEKDRDAGKVNDHRNNTEPDTTVIIEKQRLTGEEFKVWLWFRQVWHRYTTHFGEGEPEFESFNIVAPR